MAHKISVYVTEELHRDLKVAASSQGLTLSEYMVNAALKALQGPTRREVAKRMDEVRASIEERFSIDELQSMREEGRPKCSTEQQ